tara:strand:- start:2267 stop:3508 length:1242 start_codon:yes stop_codon:yes gene_type:complete
MNFNKAIKFSIILIIVLSTIFIIRDQLKIVVSKYLPTKIKSSIKILINDENFSKRLYNDYNVKFLPDTQFQKVNFSKIKLDFLKEAEANYYQKLVKKSNVGFKTFYIENFNDKLFVTSAAGETYLLNKPYKTTKTTKIKSNNLEGVNKVLDTLIVDNQFYISFIQKEKDCNFFKIYSSTIDYNEMNFEKFFDYKVCGKFIQGGRMQGLFFEGQKGLIFSLADNVSDKPTDDPQSENSFFGKILFKSLNDNRVVIFSKGHRNPQGLLVINNKILSTEHGPRGGDEINLIKYKKNYGWPLSSYGKKYNGDESYNLSHADFNFEEPIYAFVPSIGISEIIKIPENKFADWSNNYLVSSLYRGSIYRIKFNKNFNKIIFMEEIFIGKRIRDLKFVDDKIILALENYGEIGFLEVNDR